MRKPTGNTAKVVMNFRIDPELKNDFEILCHSAATSPAEMLNALIKRLVDFNSERIDEMKKFAARPVENFDAAANVDV